MGEDVGILTELLKALVATFTLGSALVIPDALALLSTLAGLEILCMGIWSLYTRQMDFGPLVAKIVGITILAWLVRGWSDLTRLVLQTFVFFGLKAGGDAISYTDFTDPSNIAAYGMNVAATVMAHLSQPEYQGMGALYNLPLIVLSGIVMLLIVGAYFALALWIFVVLLEFYATTAFSVVLIPWGALRYTSFLAEKTFAALCAAGIQVMALAFVTSAALPVMVRLQGGMHPTFRQLLVQLLGAGALGGLAWRIHKLAHVITSGSPQLTINDVGQIVQTTVTTLSTATSTAASMRESLRSIGSSAANAASNLTTRRRA